MNRKNSSLCLRAPILGSLSFLVVALSGCQVQFEPKITLAELVTLLVTLTLAVAIPWWLQRLVESRTRQSASIARLVDQFFMSVGTIQELVERTRHDSPMDEPTQRHSVIGQLRICSNNLELLAEALGDMGYGKASLVHLEALRHHLTEYKKALTSRAMPCATFVPSHEQLTKLRRSFRRLGSAHFRLLRTL